MPGRCPVNQRKKYLISNISKNGCEQSFPYLPEILFWQISIRSNLFPCHPHAPIDMIGYLGASEQPLVPVNGKLIESFCLWKCLIIEDILLIIKIIRTFMYLRNSFTRIYGHWPFLWPYLLIYYILWNFNEYEIAYMGISWVFNLKEVFCHLQ